MSRRVSIALLLLAAIVLTLVWTGVHMSFAYVRQTTLATGELRRESISISRGDATRVAVQIGMTGGALNLSGGAAHLLDGYVESNSEWLYPIIQYEENNQLGLLKLAHRDLSATGRVMDASAHTAAWDLQLNSSLPISTLDVNVGADVSTIDLRDLRVRAARIDMIGGELTVDLAQAWSEDVNVQVTGITGDLTIRLPKSTGVNVFLEPGLGQVDMQGLVAPAGEADRLVSAAYGKTPTTLTLTVNMALGSVDLIVES